MYHKDRITLITALVYVIFIMFGYARSLEAGSESAESYFKRGAAHLESGQYQWAIEDFNRALEINPQYAQAYYNRGIAYYYLGQMDRACTDAHRACELGDCNLLNALRQRGLCRFAFRRRL